MVDVDTSVEDDQQKIIFIPDREKAALSGIGTEDIARTLHLANDGLVAGFMQIPSEVNPLPVVLRLPLEIRSSPHALSALRIKGRPGILKIREKSGPFYGYGHDRDDCPCCACMIPSPFGWKPA